MIAIIAILAAILFPVFARAREKARQTNCLENYWSLLKRCIRGTYVSVEPFHLFRYLDEEDFRFNNRKIDDAGRFLATASAVAGKRLTYNQLIGESETV